MMNKLAYALGYSVGVIEGKARHRHSMVSVHFAEGRKTALIREDVAWMAHQRQQEELLEKRREQEESPI